MSCSKFLAAFFVAVVTTPSFAWGPVGHAAVGGIADRLLMAGAREQVAALLAHDLDKDGKTSGRTELEQVASWADEVRKTCADRPTWHYDDLPACGTVPVVPTWCDSGCATKAIADQEAILTDTSKTERQRNEALKWIVHLVGDLHQPLHAADNVYKDGVVDAEGSHDDRGGNDVPVVLTGYAAKEELHGIWDTDLVHLAFGHSKTDNTHLTSDQLDQQAAIASQLDPARLDKTPAQWAKESNALARTVAYSYKGFACGKPLDTTVTLTKAYQTKAEKLIPTQIELSGARLAALLNRLFP